MPPLLTFLILFPGDRVVNKVKGAVTGFYKAFYFTVAPPAHPQTETLFLTDRPDPFNLFQCRFKDPSFVAYKYSIEIVNRSIR